MALFFECMLLCAQKVLDTADIVREAIYQQPPLSVTQARWAFLCWSLTNVYSFQPFGLVHILPA